MNGSDVGEGAIGIDGFNIALQNGTGVASYGVTLARTLHDMGRPVTGVFGIDPGADPKMREILFFDRLWRQAGVRTPAMRRRARRQLWPAYWPLLRETVHDVPLTNRVDRFQLAERFPPFSRLVSRSRLFDLAHRYFRCYGRFLEVEMRDPPAIMHWTYPLPIKIAGTWNIYTVHDIVPLRLPYTTLDEKIGYRRLLAKCVQEGDHICTVSETSRTDILAEFKADPQRVSNCYQASAIEPNLSAATADSAAMVQGVFALKQRSYFLFFGAIEPKKNVGRLIEAYLSLNTKTPLVIVGGRGWQSEEELLLLPEEKAIDTERGRRVAERIIRLSHLPRNLLTALIQNARAVVFPSIFEGFGLPILEAMQVGTPLLTSNVGALREIAGDAALLVDPYDPQSIMAGLKALDDDGGLRARLSAAGLTRAEVFSPLKYADRLADMYAMIENGPARA